MEENKFTQKVLTAAVDRYVLTPTQCMMLRQDAEVIGMKRATVLNKNGKTRISFSRTAPPAGFRCRNITNGFTQSWPN